MAESLNYITIYFNGIVHGVVVATSSHVVCTCHIFNGHKIWMYTVQPIMHCNWCLSDILKSECLYWMLTCVHGRQSWRWGRQQSGWYHSRLGRWLWLSQRHVMSPPALVVLHHKALHLWHISNLYHNEVYKLSYPSFIEYCSMAIQLWSANPCNWRQLVPDNASAFQNSNC